MQEAEAQIQTKEEKRLASAQKRQKAAARKVQKKEDEEAEFQLAFYEYTTANDRVCMLREQINGPITITGSYDKIQERVQQMKWIIRDLKGRLDREMVVFRRCQRKYDKLIYKRNLAAEATMLKEDTRRLVSNEKKTAKESTIVSNKRIDLNKILLLPEVLVDIIQSYLPYEIRTEMIEERYKPFNLISKNLSLLTIRSFLTHICTQPTYFTLLTTQEKRAQIYDANNWSSWKPDWAKYHERQYVLNKLVHTIRVFKVLNPKAAYNFIRMLCILINPEKKYRNIKPIVRLTTVPI
jgi:hypothetical protein